MNKFLIVFFRAHSELLQRLRFSIQPQVNLSFLNLCRLLPWYAPLRKAASFCCVTEQHSEKSTARLFTKHRLQTGYLHFADSLSAICRLPICGLQTAYLRFADSLSAEQQRIVEQVGEQEQKIANKLRHSSLTQLRQKKTAWQGAASSSHFNKDKSLDFSNPCGN